MKGQLWFFWPKTDCQQKHWDSFPWGPSLCHCLKGSDQALSWVFEVLVLQASFQPLKPAQIYFWLRKFPSLCNFGAGTESQHCFPNRNSQRTSIDWENGNFFLRNLRDTQSGEKKSLIIFCTILNHHNRPGHESLSLTTLLSFLRDSLK